MALALFTCLFFTIKLKTELSCNISFVVLFWSETSCRTKEEWDTATLSPALDAPLWCLFLSEVEFQTGAQIGSFNRQKPTVSLFAILGQPLLPPKSTWVRSDGLGTDLGVCCCLELPMESQSTTVLSVNGDSLLPPDTYFVMRTKEPSCYYF